MYSVVDQNRMPNPTIPAWLNESYTQGYEDVVVCSALEAYQHRNNVALNGQNLTYVEIGANHPVATNSTFLISRVFGVYGYLVEPNPKLAQQLRQYRPNDAVLEVAVTTSDEETLDFFICEDNEVSSLDQKFVQEWAGITHSYPGVQEKITVNTAKINEILSLVSTIKLVVLSIDVEGMDLQILKDIDYDEYRPYIIIVEPSEAYNPGNTQNMIKFMKEKNYTLISANFVNLIFQDATQN